MPFQINDAELERKLDRHAKCQPVPTTKGRLAIQIVRSVLADADAQGIDAGRLIERMRPAEKAMPTTAVA
jgi:hypothetical protein